MATKDTKEELAETIRQYNGKGWSPATSTNYSYKDEEGIIWVSQSGIDKSSFKAENFITVDNNAEAIGEYIDCKPSAETLIHCTIYKLFPETKVILHSHSIFPVLLSEVEGEKIAFQGYEMQKAFEGQTTHEDVVNIPIFENTQNMKDFKTVLVDNVEKIKQHAFLIRKHGTYAWGRNLFEAKRHLEALDYLCECEWKFRK